MLSETIGIIWFGLGEAETLFCIRKLENPVLSVPGFSFPNRAIGKGRAGGKGFGQNVNSIDNLSKGGIVGL